MSERELLEQLQEMQRQRARLFEALKVYGQACEAYRKSDVASGQGHERVAQAIEQEVRERMYRDARRLTGIRHSSR